MSTGLSILNAWLVIEGHSVLKQRVDGQYLAACTAPNHKNLQFTDVFLKVGYVRGAEECYEN
jgi:hypothetical protein